MNSKQTNPINIFPAGDDHVIPFQVEELDVQERAVQSGPMLDAILDNTKSCNKIQCIIESENSADNQRFHISSDRALI